MATVRRHAQPVEDEPVLALGVPDEGGGQVGEIDAEASPGQGRDGGREEEGEEPGGREHRGPAYGYRHGAADRQITPGRLADRDGAVGDGHEVPRILRTAMSSAVCADEGGDDADHELFGGPHDDPAHHVREEQEGGAHQGGEERIWARKSTPTRARTTCGTARPTKAIGPTAAVAAALSRVAAISPPARVRPGCEPRATAVASPRARALRPGPRARAIRKPAAA